MGFRLNKTYVLKFPDLGDGTAEVRMKGVSLGRFYEIQDAKGDRATAELIAPLLISWNMDDEDGQPLPLTADGMMGLEPSVFSQLYGAWVDAQIKVSADLGKGSTSGDTSPEASLPMEPL